MKSFFVDIEELLSVKKNHPSEDFKENYRKLLIPKYQREYKWEEGRIEDFINDIKHKKKFLGNVLLDEITDGDNGYYEVIDGQQRITTILLALLAVHNLYGQSNPPSLSEQQAIRNKINFQTDRSLFLQNDSLGRYIVLNGTNLILSIENDIYLQNITFQKAYDKILEILKKDIAGLQTFKTQLYQSKMLVVINSGTNLTDSTEEMFLDINYKLQPLDSANIFKGYCFKNIVKDYHNDLKNAWAKIVLCGKGFEKLGYSDLCEFLYYYLLSQPDSKNITKNLTKGRSRIHYLEGKNTDQTQLVLSDIQTYGENILSFLDSLNVRTYGFEDVFTDTQSFDQQNEKDKFVKICQDIMQSSILIHKIPFFFLINSLKKDIALKTTFNKETIKSIMTHAYVYYALFMADDSKKNRDRRDYSIAETLLGSAERKSTAVAEAYKKLKKDECESFEMQKGFNEEAFFAISTVTDFYDRLQNSLSYIYTAERYNREHFIVHDSSFVVWRSDGKSDITIFEESYIKGSNYLKKLFSDYKSKTTNYIILEKEFNRDTLGSLDIITKINLIKDHFGDEIPKLIKVYIDHIEAMNAYMELVEAKNLELTKDEIQTKYHSFYIEYFGVEKQNELAAEISLSVKRSVLG